jgi:hypothetical protein
MYSPQPAAVMKIIAERENDAVDRKGSFFYFRCEPFGSLALCLLFFWVHCQGRLAQRPRFLGEATARVWPVLLGVLSSVCVVPSCLVGRGGRDARPEKVDRLRKGKGIKKKNLKKKRSMWSRGGVSLAPTVPLV